MSINRVIVSGNLTRDPELRYSQGGTPILAMGVAVNDRAKNPQTGEWEDRPNFVDLTMFGTRAEKVAPYLQKGSKVAVEGKLRWSQWQAKDGSKRSKLEVVVDEIEFMSRDGEVSRTAAPVDGGYYAANQSPQGYAPQPQAGYAPQPVNQGGQVPYDADIPF